MIANGGSKAEIAILNHVPIVREKDMMAPEDADTPVKRLYASLLDMYIHPERSAEAYRLYRLLLEQLISTDPDEAAMELLSKISALLVAGDHYKAMRACKKLIRHEEDGETKALQTVDGAAAPDDDADPA